MPVTTIDSSGSYEGMGDKSAATSTTGGPGAIVEGPGGNVFIKCTGRPRRSPRINRSSTSYSVLSKKKNSVPYSSGTP